MPPLSASVSPRPPRSKLVASVLALLLGVVGAHHWYLRRRFAWLTTLAAFGCMALAVQVDPWWDTPAFLVLFIPMIDGFIEAAVLSLMPADRFDRRYNPKGGTGGPVGVGAVLVALASALFGGVFGMFAVAMVVLYVYRSMGWLDGLAY